MKTSVYRARIFGIFQKHPTSSYTVAELEREFRDINKPVINYWLKEFIKDGTVIKPRYGHYQFNPSPPDIAAIRAEALKRGQDRVVDTGRTWRPGEEALQVHPEHPAIPSRRLHFLSILERMASNPAFSRFDVELLKEVAPQLIKEEKILTAAS